MPFVLWGHGVPAQELPPPFLCDVVPTLLARAGVADSAAFAAFDGVDLLAADRAALAGRTHWMRENELAGALQGPWKWLAGWTRQAPAEFGRERLASVMTDGASEKLIAQLFASFWAPPTFSIQIYTTHVLGAPGEALLSLRWALGTGHAQVESTKGAYHECECSCAEGLASAWL